MAAAPPAWKDNLRSLVLLNPITRQPARHGLASVAVGVLLAVVVFYVDTFTDIHSALATLYVITLLLSAETLTERGTLLLTAACICLAIFAFLTAHGLDADLAAVLRLMVSIAALLITCALIVRNQRARLDLVKFNTALGASEARYRSIFEQSRVALWERDYSRARTLVMSLKADGIDDLRAYAKDNPGFVSHCMGLISTVAANAAAFALIGNAAIYRGDTIGRYLVPDDAKFLDLISAIFNGETHYEGKGTIASSDGVTKLVLLTVGFPEDVASFDRVIVGMIDITEREMAQKAMFEAHAELALASKAATVGALSASLAHELNQPLGAIVVNAQTLLRWLNREPPDLQAVGRSAERIVRDSQRASDIIHNTRSMLSRQAPIWEAVSLVDLVTETRSLLDNDLARHAIAFDLTAPDDIEPINAVRIELQQVVINLVTNAIQAMSDPAQRLRQILVSVSGNDDGSVSLRVRDTGPGMPDSVMQNLFKPFHSSKETGLGMGLAICRSMMEARGGSLTADNHVDGGAIFEMTIPREASRD